MRWDLGVRMERKSVDTAQQVPVSAGCFPAYPKPEPMRRTCCLARSPKAMRCVTEAARVRASSGSLSSKGSYPVAILILEINRYRPAVGDQAPGS